MMLAEQGHGAGASASIRQASKPGVLVATRLFGASGQPWMWRQVVGLRELRQAVLCWERHNPVAQSAGGIPMHVLPGETAPYDGRGRWAYRLMNLPRRNFYAALGGDRRRIADVLRIERPSVVLSYFGDIGMRVLPAARRAGIPVVAYCHGDFLFVTNRWYRWSFLRCLADFAAIVVVTNSERRWLREQGVADEKIHVIPCGAPTDLFRPRVRNPQDAVRFVMSSRLIAEKGCHLSVAAFVRLAAILDGVELHVYGDGPARADLQRTVSASGVQSKVFFHGYVGEERLADELSSHDVFIQHSLRKEGSPVSIVEAMAAGLPVVATPVGGIADQVLDGETGLLIAENDVIAMTAAMERLARDGDLRRRLGRAGRVEAVHRHEARQQTRRLEQVLLDVARPRLDAAQFGKRMMLEAGCAS